MRTLIRALAPLLGSALLAFAFGGCPSPSTAPDAGGGGDEDAGVEPISNVFKLRYHRPHEDYAGWTVQVTAGAVETSAAPGAEDGFGAVFTLTIAEGAPELAFTLNGPAGEDPAGALTVDVSGTVREAFVFSGYEKAIPRALPAIPGDDQVAVYYLRADGTYDGWGLHTWGDVAKPTSWSGPLRPKGVDADLGAGFVIDVKPGGDRVNIIAHKGDNKDPGPDMGWNRSVLGDIVFLTSGSATLTTVPRKVGELDIAGGSAHLLRRDLVAWNLDEPSAESFELRYSATAEVKAAGTDVTGGSVIALAPRASGLPTEILAAMPHLALPGWRAFDIAAEDLAKVEEALKGQLVAVARKADLSAVLATQVQTARALDDLYPYDGPLGVTFATVAGAPTFTLWAPTAQAVKLHVVDAAKDAVAGSPFAMTRGALGEWTASGQQDWYGGYYRYEVTAYHPVTSSVETVLVTDPYAVNLSTNGLYAQIVDLADPALRPAGWDTFTKPALAAPEDIVLYETHIRDFSANDATVEAARRGKYLAFEPTATRSEGLDHLAELAAAGLTHVHLLPAFDIATVDEDAANRVDLGDPFSRLCDLNSAVPAELCARHAGKTIREAMASLPWDSSEQQAIAGHMRGLDSFNWGYDPFHYGAPEGSYASTPEGTAKIVEFRRMVMGLASLGLRVVMDVVYNHTNASGIGPKSVLDKIVPNYYHRLDPITGFVLTSSCCANTASEHRMMERLMTETLVRWARDYKVDGFRFDLMGLHFKPEMVRVRDALAALTVAGAGVDGSKIYLYGEGWDMGELVNLSRGVNATQFNMAGTGIGTFNDRLRDGARGGGPFDSQNDLRIKQGFMSGLYTEPNELAAATQVEKDALAKLGDHIKIGMAGNLKDFRLLTSTGVTAAGAGVGYNGKPTGYTLDPQEVINYVSKHDNQTLWDILQYKLATGVTRSDRERMHALALDVVMLGQGVPFFHAGDDLLRSKSMERDSYDSGDWFNRVDWTGDDNAWRSGLPNEGKDKANWPLVKAIFANDNTVVDATQIAAAREHFREMLRIRKSTPLFRLRTREQVMARVDFLNGGTSQTPGVIAMTVTDGTCAGADLDSTREAVVVIVNADTASHEVTVPTASGFELHPVLAASADPTVRTASVTGEVFTVPARTTAVFQKPQAAAQGAGLPCNTR